MTIFMAHRAIPIIAFPQVRTIYIYIYIYVCATCMSIYALYAWCVKEHALELYRPAERKLLVAYVETGTNS